MCTYKTLRQNVLKHSDARGKKNATEVHMGYYSCWGHWRLYKGKRIGSGIPAELYSDMQKGLGAGQGGRPEKAF
jgi:hypothetical protein